MRLVAAMLCIGLIENTRIAQSAEPDEQSLAKKEFGKSSFALAGASAVLGHIADRPGEWGRGASALAKRFGAAFGKHLVNTSVQVGVAALRHEDLKYYPSDKQGFRPRLQHALVSTVVARKKTTGKRTPATSRIAGSAAGGFVSRLWQPARLHTISSGIGSTGISLGVDAGFNVVREFWPEIRHPGRRQ